jgi:hypothetical protein
MMTKVRMLILGRALHSASRRDPEILGETQAWDNGFTLAITVLPNGPCLGFEKTGSGLVDRGGSLKTADLELRFKTLESASRLLSARLGLDEAMAGHCLRIRGDVSAAVTFSRILGIMGTLLHPWTAPSVRENGTDAPRPRRLGLRLWLYTFGILLGK